MLEELSQKLIVDLKKILDNTISFGMNPDEKGRMSLSLLGETVVTMEKWKWLTHYDLEEVLYLIPDYCLKDRMILKGQKKQFPVVSADSVLDPSLRPLFLGTSKELADKILRDGPGKKEAYLRLVNEPELAGLISIYHTGFNGSTPDKQSTILVVDSAAVFRDGGKILKTHSPFLLGESLKSEHFSNFRDQDQFFLQLRWEIRVNETLYMEYSDQSRLAAEDLFQLKSQTEVENILIEHLMSNIPEVRRNVAQALGLPCYQQGFLMGAPRPSRRRLLESVSVQPETLKKMLNAVKRESDLEAAHWFVCSLGAQYYGGKLRNNVDEVYDIAGIIDSRFGNELRTDTNRLRETVTGC